MSGHLDLSRCHVNVALGNAEAHDVCGVNGQLGFLEIECQAVLLQGRQDLSQCLEMVVPMLVVDNDAVDMNQDSWEIFQHGDKQAMKCRLGPDDS